MAILCITEVDQEQETDTIIVSHGFDLDNDRLVVLPMVHPTKLGAVFSHQYGEWIIPDKKP